MSTDMQKKFKKATPSQVASLFTKLAMLGYGIAGKDTNPKSKAACEFTLMRVHDMTL